MLGRRLFWQRFLPAGCRIEIRDNHFNHLALDSSGEIFFVTGIAHDRKAVPLQGIASHGRVVIELPHSGYIPANCQDRFNRPGLRTEIFVLMPVEESWRGFDGLVGVITSPEYFMSKGPLKAERRMIDYAADCRKIRAEIQASGVPARYFVAPDPMVSAIIDYLEQ